MLTIRPATGNDLDDAAEVWLRSALQMDGATSPMPTFRKLRDRMDSELERDWELFVAERDLQTLGMLALKPSTAILDQIFVLPAAQAQGVGSALLDRAKQRMPDGFRLRAASANKRAARFYERSGLILVERGIHPLGHAVSYYQWNGL